MVSKYSLVKPQHMHSKITREKLLCVLKYYRGPKGSNELPESPWPALWRGVRESHDAALAETEGRQTLLAE